MFQSRGCGDHHAPCWRIKKLFLIGIGATYLVLNMCSKKLSLEPVSIVGATGRKENRLFFRNITI